MASHQVRYGHAAIGAILSNMAPYLPPSTIDRPGYKHCRVAYGLLNTTHQRVKTSDAPEKVYKELQHLGHALRRRLQNLNASKGIPVKMIQFLDELDIALDRAVMGGVDADFRVEHVGDLLEQKPEQKPEVQPLPPSEKPTKCKKCLEITADLAAACKKIQRLNAENNNLIMRVKKLETERDAAKRAPRPGVYMTRRGDETQGGR
ncbi:hypothetical protein EJ07DRAFT_155208 [Lizonia empirigonia]|nr:hypothetical protein EJ07DRAFT_155208 [Lizonia empirigonia]